jgi:FtsP/CotA-like multicopper oxidase with cupredoxin domain
MSSSLSRRHFLTLAGGTAAVGVLAACTSSGTNAARLIGPSSSQVAAAEARRRATGRVTALNLSARPVTVDLAGRQVNTWAYQPSLAGPEIRLRVGDRLQATLMNQLPDSTSVHWHGVAMRNDMDGVPGVTQAPTQPGAQFRYDFVVPDAGTYWFHSHQGVQLDRGLYGPLVVEDPDDPGVDVDQVLVLDDWLDGITGTPDQQLATLRNGMSGMSGMPASTGGMGATMGGMNMGPSASGSGMGAAMTSSLLGGDAGDITYPLHLVNGRPPADRLTVTAAARGKVRLRLINAGSDTAYRVAVGGHRLTVTHADGRPIQPVTVDAVLLGMGERYDIEFIAASGAWPIYALAEGKNAAAVAVLRTTDASASTAPPITAEPAELQRTVLSYTQLTPAAGQALSTRQPDRRFTVDLTGTMAMYQWGLGGDAKKLDIHPGERVRIVMRNRSGMWHPMHLHGHTFALVGHAGVRKDTVNILPAQSVTIDFDADNPGQWAYHCHNAYHQALGMMTTLTYRQ